MSPELWDSQNGVAFWGTGLLRAWRLWFRPVAASSDFLVATPPFTATVSDHTQPEVQPNAACSCKVPYPFGKGCVLHTAPSISWKGISDYLHQPTLFTILSTILEFLVWLRFFFLLILHIYIYIYIYIYTRTHTHTYTYIHIYIHTHTHIYVYMGCACLHVLELVGGEGCTCVWRPEVDMKYLPWSLSNLYTEVSLNQELPYLSSLLFYLWPLSIWTPSWPPHPPGIYTVLSLWTRISCFHGNHLALWTSSLAIAYLFLLIYQGFFF